MNLTNKRIGWLGVGALWALASGLPALADDTELFVGSSTNTSVRPNVLFIVDNSGSMDTKVETQDTYKSTTTYPDQGCSVNRVYWRATSSGAAPPACNTSNYFALSAMQCKTGLAAFDAAGYHIDMAARYDKADDKRWERFDNNYHNDVVDCQDDWGVHGGGDNSKRYPADKGGAVDG